MPQISLDQFLKEIEGSEKESSVITQEKILVCVNLDSNSEYLIRRGFRISRMLNAPLFILHVKREKYDFDRDKAMKMGELRKLCTKLEVEFEVAIAKDPAAAIIEFAKEHGITKVVVGQSTRTRLHKIIGDSILRKVMRGIKSVDVMVIAEIRK